MTLNPELEKLICHSEEKRLAKGQLIPKGLFGFLNSSKKRTKTIRPEVSYTVVLFDQIFSFFRSFYGRIEGTKKSF